MAFLYLKLVDLRLHPLELDRHLVAFYHTSLKLLTNMANDLLCSLNLLVSVICRARCAPSSLWDGMLFEVSGQLFVGTNELADSRELEKALSETCNRVMNRCKFLSLFFKFCITRHSRLPWLLVNLICC